PGSATFGGALAAIAAGTAPGGYAASPAIEERVKLLGAFLRSGLEKATPLNRAMVLWASAKLPGVLSTEGRERIAAELTSRQEADGGWSTAALAGDWRRHDGTPQERETDGYATGLITCVLEQAGRPPADPAVARGRAWLIAHQDRESGR